MGVGDRENLSEAAGDVLIELAEKHPALAVFSARADAIPSAHRFSGRFPSRFHRAATEADAWSAARQHAGQGHSSALLSTPEALVRNLTELVGAAAASTGSLLVLSEPAGGSGPSPRDSAGIEGLDVELLRNVPRLHLLVPADGPTARSMVRQAATLPGATVLRLPSEPQPTVGEGNFELGRAQLLRDGTDLTLVANGPAVAIALETADELGRVGVKARVLDFASVKPFDTKGIVRAARETGALLCLESQNLFAGLGALVAATTAQTEPVPVRRVGAPDLWAPEGVGEGMWLTKERALEEAWELLRARGKVR